MTLPKIGITLGDPGGIGPEITLKAFARLHSLPKAQYIIFGSSLVLNKEKQDLGLNLNILPFKKQPSPSLSSLSLWEVSTPPLKEIKKGASFKANGKASFLFFEEAVKAASEGTIQALVTAPVSKKSWNMAGIHLSGHTDFLSREYPQAIMTFWSDRLKVALFSHHLSLKESLKRIKKKYLLEFFLHLDQHLKNIQSQTFNFLVAGLNPHAGEDGLLGNEEKDEIIPAIHRAQQQGMNIIGPFPPDIVFRKALNYPDKMVVALYHDQGLIPFKLAAFDDGVNLTLGLPFIRTSPDHGTAFDIAGKGKANPLSMIKSIELAYLLSPLF
jgi:4-hydroxythreonine-4-phosphate dehydrogenase